MTALAPWWGPLLGADLPVPERRATEVRRAVHEVLARAEFRPPPKSPMRWLVDFVLARLSDVLGPLLNGGTAAVVGWVAVAGVVAAVVFLALRFSRGITSDAARSAAAAGMPRRSAVDWRRAAEGHEREGEWRMALRCRYRALIADLARHGTVDEVPGRTAGEYRAEVRANRPGAAAEFAGATELFEAAWYGNRPTGQAEHGRFTELADRVLQEAAR